jgi:oxaloacetate decarboxylase alpha subunit
MPANLIDAMQAAGPAPRHYDPQLRPVLALLRQLADKRDLTAVTIEKPGFKLWLNGGAR